MHHFSAPQFSVGASTVPLASVARPAASSKARGMSSWTSLSIDSQMFSTPAGLENDRIDDSRIKNAPSGSIFSMGLFLELEIGGSM